MAAGRRGLRRPSRTGRSVRLPSVGSSGRAGDHNPFGFSVWLVGGVKGGTTRGATDDFGFGRSRRSSIRLAPMEERTISILPRLPA